MSELADNKMTAHVAAELERLGPPAEGIKGHLQAMLALRRASHREGLKFVEEFLLDHGKCYQTDKKSFIGGKPGMCYANSFSAVMKDRSLTYVEGYVTVCGVPINHAWTVDQQGIVRDYTLKRDLKQSPREYFGVAFKPEFMLKTVLKNGYYGLLSWPSGADVVLKSELKEMLALSSVPAS